MSNKHQKHEYTYYSTDKNTSTLNIRGTSGTYFARNFSDLVKDTDKGTKHDSGKVRMDLIPLESLKGLAKVLEHGASKYGENNWQLGLDKSRLLAAALRHISAFQAGTLVDEESGLFHIDHALCNLIFLSHFESNKNDKS